MRADYGFDEKRTESLIFGPGIYDPLERIVYPRDNPVDSRYRTEVNEESGLKEINMAFYGKQSQESVKRAMEKMKEGTLKSGASGKKVRNPKQAIAIGLSEARSKGG
jgi:hypothetical protein